MKTMPASHIFHDNPSLEETEFALSVSPRPQIERSPDRRKNTEFASGRSAPDRCRQSQRPSQTVFDDNELTETLTIGWAIALAIAVAMAVYVSGG